MPAKQFEKLMIKMQEFLDYDLLPVSQCIVYVHDSRIHLSVDCLLIRFITKSSRSAFSTSAFYPVLLNNTVYISYDLLNNAAKHTI